MHAPLHGILSAAAAATLLLCLPFHAPAQQSDRRITTTGEATVYVQPDHVQLTFGIQTRDRDIVKARQLNMERVRKSLDVALGAGVAPRDLQTDQLTIEPRWRWSNEDEGDFLHYRVRNSFVVTLRDTTLVDDLITSQLLAGVDTVHSVDFQTSDVKKYREQAREMAAKAAREKADKLAAALGAKVARVVTISEGQTGTPYFWSTSRYWGYSGGSAMTQNAVFDARGDLPAPTGETLALGKLAVRGSITVTFELE